MDKKELAKIFFLFLGVIFCILCSYFLIESYQSNKAEELSTTTVPGEISPDIPSTNISDYFSSNKKGEYISEDELPGGGCVIQGSVVKNGSVNTDTVCLVNTPQD